MIGTRYDVAVEPAAPLAVFEARGPEAELAAALAAARLPWPVAPHRSEAGEDGAAVVRLGPTRLLVLAPRDAGPDLAARLDAAFAAQETADAIDVSDMLAGFVVAGPGALDVLRQGAPLDLAPDRFPPGATTGTELWGVAVLIARLPAPTDAFRILVDVAQAAFVEEWLSVACGAGPLHRPGTMIRPPARLRPKS